jgi:hypothetical protein
MPDRRVISTISIHEINYLHNAKNITVYKYYHQALALRKWIPIAKPAPEFVVNISDLRQNSLACLPLNGNATAVMVVHNTDKSKMMYPTFYKSDLDKTVQSLREKILSYGILIDDDMADNLVGYFRHECVLLLEDEDSEFFKNGNGKGEGEANKSKQKPKSRSEQERQQNEQQQHEERIAAIRKNISSFEE